MELKQYPIHRKYKKCEARNQITIGNDVGVPDGKPDIAEKKYIRKKEKSGYGERSRCPYFI